MITNVRHIGLVVTDLKEAIKFYKQLGFKLGPKGVVTAKASVTYYGLKKGEEISWRKLYIENPNKPDGKDVIELYEIKSGINQRFSHISFTVNDIEGCWNYFSKKKLLMSKNILEEGGHRFFFIADPWFNMLEIVQPIGG